MSIRSSSSSSSSSSESEEISIGDSKKSIRSGSKQRSTPRKRQESSTASQISGQSAVATGTPYDTASIATSTNTGFTIASGSSSTTTAVQQQVPPPPIPVIAPPAPPQQPVQPAVNQNVPVPPVVLNGQSFQQQQQQQQQQTHFDAAKAIFTQVDTNRDGSISREEFRQWAQTGQQQAQYANPTPTQQPFNPLLGADAFSDVVLNIDYSVIEAYNVGMQSAGDITAEQYSRGFDAAKAIFNQVDTNHDGSISRDEFRQWAQNERPVHFDAAKAMFNQADINHDGSISRDEFRQWAQGAEQNYGGQSYSNYQTTVNYGNNFNNNNNNNNQIYTGGNLQVEDILRQSGLGQTFGGY